MLNNTRINFTLTITVFAAFTSLFAANIILYNPYQYMLMEMVLSLSFLALISFILVRIVRYRIAKIIILNFNFRLFLFFPIFIFLIGIVTVLLFYFLIRETDEAGNFLFYLSILIFFTSFSAYFLVESILFKLIEGLIKSVETNKFILHIYFIGFLSTMIFLHLNLFGNDFDSTLYLQYHLIFGIAYLLLYFILKLNIRRAIYTHQIMKIESVVEYEDELPKDGYLYNPFLVDEQFEYFLESNKTKDQLYFLNFVKSHTMIDKVDLLKAYHHRNMDYNPELLSTIQFFDELIEKSKHIESAYDFIETSRDTSLIKCLLRLQIVQKDYMIVQKGLTDLRPEVKKQAIWAAAYQNDVNIIPSLVELLKDPIYSQSALLALNKIGQHVMPHVRNAFYRNRENLIFIDALLKLTKMIKSKESYDFLISLLSEPQLYIQQKAASAIVDEGYELKTAHKARLSQMIEGLIATYAFNQNVIDQIDPHAEKTKHLIASIREENIVNFDTLFKLLKALVHKYTIDNFFEHLAKDNELSQLTARAIPDIHFPLSLRFKIKALFSNMTGYEMCKYLQKDYLGEKIDWKFKDQDDAVSKLLERDYNKISFWLRSCAIDFLGKSGLTEISEGIISELFNPNPLIQEIVAKTIYKLNTDYFLLYLRRFDEDTAETLNFKIESNLSERKIIRDDNFLVFDRIRFLHTIPAFRDINIIELANIHDYFIVKTLSLSKDYLNFNHFYPNGYWIIESGELNISFRGNTIIKAKPGSIIDMSLLTNAEKNTLILTNKTDIRYLFIEYNTFNALHKTNTYLQKDIIRVVLDDKNYEVDAH